jgi:hypothetical protein
MPKIRDLAAIALCFVPLATVAQDAGRPKTAGDAVMVSSYTPLASGGSRGRGCTRLTKTPPARMGDHETDSYRCPGIGGHAVWIDYHAASITVAIGVMAAGKPPAALSADKGFGPRIEWRGPATARGLAAQAAIVRLLLSGGAGEEGPVLAVVRLAGAKSCVSGLVDGGAKDANEVARRLADRAAQFRCGEDRIVMAPGNPKLLQYAKDRLPN